MPDRDALDALITAIETELRDGYCFNRMDQARRALHNIRSAAREARAAVRKAHDEARTELAAVEAVVRREVCPAENTEGEGEARYIAMNENGDVFIEVDTLAEVVQEMSRCWAATQERAEKAESAVRRLAEQGEGTPCLVTGHGYGESGVPFLRVSGNVEHLQTGTRVLVRRVEEGA